MIKKMYLLRNISKREKVRRVFLSKRSFNAYFVSQIFWLKIEIFVF